MIQNMIMMKKNTNMNLYFFEVYCNVYLRYSLGLLFNGNNKNTIDELSQYNSLEIIQMYRYYLHQITLRKLEKSLKSDKVNS